jgi:hypothetical protein
VVKIYGINFFYFLNSYTKDVIICLESFLGLGISVDMDQKTIRKIQPTFDLLNKDVYIILNQMSIHMT